MVNQHVPVAARSGRAERGVAAVGTVASFTALVSAAACCVLPLALAAVGIGAGGLAVIVPFHWPLTIGAGIAVLTGWLVYLRKRRACADDESCEIAPTRATFLMLCFATLFVGLSAIWPFLLEQPLMELFAG